MKTKTLPSVRIDDKTDMNMKSALKKISNDKIVPLTLQEFRRICYEYTSQKILSGEQIKLQMQ